MTCSKQPFKKNSRILRHTLKLTTMKKVKAGSQTGYIQSTTSQDFQGEKHHVVDSKGDTIWFNGLYWWNDEDLKELL